MNVINEEVLTGTQAITTESFSELNSKLGAQWFINEQFSIANSTTINLVLDIVATNTNRFLLKKFAFDADDQLTFNFYWKLTDWNQGGGTPVDVKNFHDSPQNSTITTAKFDPTAGTAPTEQQRASTIITPASSNQFRQGAFKESTIEFVVTQASQMMFRFSNQTGGEEQVNFEATWYEGPLSTDTKGKTGGGF